MRKLGGYMLGMFSLIIYIFLVTSLGDALFPMHIALEVTFYAVMGIGWIFPAMLLIRWWYRPKDTE